MAKAKCKTKTSGMRASNVIDFAAFKAKRTKPSQVRGFDHADPHYLAFAEMRDTLAKRAGVSLQPNSEHARQWQEALARGNTEERLNDLRMMLT